MLAGILPYLRCPQCDAMPLRDDSDDGLACPSCEVTYPLRDGILDMLGSGPAGTVTPFQRIMQTPLIVAIYERAWRRIGYFLASSRSFAEEISTVLKHGETRCEGPVLDLACGTGVFTRPLAQQRNGLVVGFDLSWPMLRRAQHLTERSGLKNIIFVHGTVFRLPFITGSLRYVNCCGALHLFDNYNLALNEINRVLHPGGHLCVQTTIRPTRSWGIFYFLERFIRFGFFDESELHAQIRGRGFSILESERHRISYTFLARHA